MNFRVISLGKGTRSRKAPVLSPHRCSPGGSTFRGQSRPGKKAVFSLAPLFFRGFFVLPQDFFFYMLHDILITLGLHIHEDLLLGIQIESLEGGQPHVVKHHDLHPGVCVLDLRYVEKHKFPGTLAQLPMHVVVQTRDLH